MRHLSFLLALSAITSGYSQDLAAWAGHYKGPLKITHYNGKVDDYFMELKIAQADTGVYDWTIIYGDSAQDVRPYQLIHKEANFYDMDEKNSIVMSCTLFGDELICMFELSGTCIWVSYRLTDSGIEVKLTSHVFKNETGGAEYEEEDIPVVGSYSTVVSQTAMLIKK